MTQHMCDKRPQETYIQQLSCTINFTVLSCLLVFLLSFVTLLVAESSTQGHKEQENVPQITYV